MKKYTLFLLLLIISVSINNNCYADISDTTSENIFYVKESSLNLRNGPGTNFIITARLYRSQEVHLLEKYDENWWKVEVVGSDLNKVEGFVNKKYLDIPEVVELSWFKSLEVNLFGDEMDNSEKEIVYYISGFFLLIIIVAILIAIPNKTQREERRKNKTVKNKEVKTNPIFYVLGFSLIGFIVGYGIFGNVPFIGYLNINDIFSFQQNDSSLGGLLGGIMDGYMIEPIRNKIIISTVIGGVIGLLISIATKPRVIIQNIYQNENTTTEEKREENKVEE